MAPLPAAPDVHDSTPNPSKADFDELKRLVLSLSASVDAMRDQLATKEQVEAVARMQMETKEQVDAVATKEQIDAVAEQVEAVATREQVEAVADQVEELFTAVDTLAYNTKARFCNKKRTDKGTALLSLKDKDGVLVDINQPEYDLLGWWERFGFADLETPANNTAYEQLAHRDQREILQQTISQFIGTRC